MGWTKMQFSKHYTREEASALLPQVRRWLERLVKLQADLERLDREVNDQTAGAGDTGGKTVNAWVRSMAEVKDVLLEFYRREIQVKDLERGLIDFPSLIDGREVFLCWEKKEEDIEFWHDLDAGYAGRRRLEDE